MSCRVWPARWKGQPARFCIRYRKISSLDSATDLARESRSNATEAIGTISGLAEWAESTGDQFESLRDALSAMEKESEEIKRIAKEVHMLAINASIVAARAGEEGRAFTVVSAAINELSQSTSKTAGRITDSLKDLKGSAGAMVEEGREAHNKAVKVREGVASIDDAFENIEGVVADIRSRARTIERESQAIDNSSKKLNGSVREIESAASVSAEALSKATDRTTALIDMGEELVALSADLGGSTVDSPFIEKVQQMAAQAGRAFEQGIADGSIIEAALFDRHYEPIPNSDPQQFMAPFTSFTDRVLPPIQEAALGFDRKVVFCASVDTNGYLPTHNLKFSRPQGNDPVWNAANCRNRRIFNDRVGLKAGRNTNRFLLQTYRRDMGGGNFVMMKDLSAPIMVNGRHWGGLRFAYGFS